LASENLTGLTLELGGNDPAVILDDADLSPVALDRIFAAIFDTSGQICMNIKRVYVHESRLAEVVGGLRERLATVRLGHGLDPETTHGPLHSEKHADYVRSLIDEARSSGATVEQFGEIPEGVSPDRFVLPTLVIDPDPSLRLVTDEQFGPVIPVMSFSNLDSAVAAANDSWAGLGASVWSADTDRAHSVANRLAVGYVWINDHGAPRLDLRAPFGGTKHSGFGREQGLDGFLEFTETRAISQFTGDS
jgi:acyl-CoA reductase-like NAD-dependent aldehyde dehydrogenase